MAPISDKLDQFFTEKMKEYPTKRGFLVPMLLYTQDELGYLSDEAISHLAKKTELSELEVRNVISYYSHAGYFDNDTIDLGNGLQFAVDVQATSRQAEKVPLTINLDGARTQTELNLEAQALRWRHALPLGNRAGNAAQVFPMSAVAI